MTRLINIEDAALLKTVMDGGLSAKALWRRINAQPTIDAVPIEWILKWKEKFENAYSDEYDPTVAEMLVDMLEDWREEK